MHCLRRCHPTRGNQVAAFALIFLWFTPYRSLQQIEACRLSDFLFFFPSEAAQMRFSELLRPSAGRTADLPMIGREWQTTQVQPLQWPNVP